MIVIKFGGTSLQDADAIERAAEIVASRLDQQPAVIVSALGGATNALIAIGEQAAKGHLIGALRGVEELRDRHLRECEKLLNGSPDAAPIAEELSATFDELASLAEALSVLGHATPRSFDKIAASGEELSSQLIAAFFRMRGIRAEHVDAREVFITDSSFTCAEPLPDLIAERARELVLPLMDDGKVPILGGFIGSNADGVTTTLGRGGSDYSAAIVGAAVGAEEIQIWTDVDGMMTCDPRLIPDARVIERISYVEAAELAWFGAKVLHPKTIAPAIEQRIPVRVLNTHNVSSLGTLITEEGDPREDGPRAIALKEGITVVHMTSNKMLGAHGFLARLFAVFESLQISIDLITTSEVSVSVTLDESGDLAALREKLAPVADVTVLDNQCIVAVVGRKLMRDSAVVGRCFEAIRGIPVSMFSLGTSGLNLSIVLDQSHADQAVRAIHRALFEAGVPA